MQSFDIVGKEIFQNALSISVRGILQLRVELRAEDGARLMREQLHAAIFPGSEQAKAPRHSAELAAMMLKTMERTAQACEQRMLREEGLRQKAELLVSLARIDERRTEGDADELMMQVLDAGAEDFVEEEDSFEVLTDPDDFSAVRLAMEEAGIPMASAEVSMIPQTYVELTDAKDIANIQKTLDMLDDDDDVQDVYHNWDE